MTGLLIEVKVNKYFSLKLSIGNVAIMCAVLTSDGHNSNTFKWA